MFIDLAQENRRRSEGRNETLGLPAKISSAPPNGRE